MDDVQELNEYLFLFGDNDRKITTYNKLISNLTSAKIEYVVGYNKSVVYIILKDIPRIIQLIFTEFENPSQVIDSFDFVHLQSYYDGSNLFTNKNTIEHISNKTTNILYRPSISRYIKYDLRGVKLDNILYQEYDFIFGKTQFCKYLKDKEKTWEKVSELYNLEDKTELFKLFWLTQLEDLESQVNLSGKFTQYTINESIEDDETKLFHGINGMNLYSFENQNYMYVKGKVVQVFEPNQANEKYQIFIEFTNLRICNYLTGLIDEVKYHIDKFNENNKKIRFVHSFIDSLGYTFKGKDNFVIQVGGLVLKICDNHSLKLNTNYNFILRPQLYYSEDMRQSGFNFKIEEVFEQKLI